MLMKNGELTVDMHYCADAGNTARPVAGLHFCRRTANRQRLAFFDNEKAYRACCAVGARGGITKELAALVDTAGGVTAGSLCAKGRDGGFGKGKLHEIALYIQAENIDLAVYDDELYGGGTEIYGAGAGCRVLTVLRLYWIYLQCAPVRARASCRWSWRRRTMRVVPIGGGRRPSRAAA